MLCVVEPIIKMFMMFFEGSLPALDSFNDFNWRFCDASLVFKRIVKVKEVCNHFNSESFEKTKLSEGY